jgi:hypothetical protein
MIRNIILFALLAVIVYCAAAPRAQASADTLVARVDVRAQRQFIPGTLAALHTAARSLVVLRATPAEPSA